MQDLLNEWWWCKKPLISKKNLLWTKLINNGDISQKRVRAFEQDEQLDIQSNFGNMSASVFAYLERVSTGPHGLLKTKIVQEE